MAQLSGEPSATPSTELLTRIKRLLDIDRALEVSPRSRKPEATKNYAFFRGSSPGKGSEVQFSSYEAFAVLIGLQMLSHKWPQKFVVGTLRRLRPDLEKQHRRILSLDPATLFDQNEIMRRARPGDIGVSSTSPVFLLIWSDQKTAEDPAPTAEIFEDPRLAYRRVIEKAGRSSTWIELTRLAHLLADQLKRSPPRKRGRT